MNNAGGGSVAVVTGGTRGLGFEVARQLIGRGWSVVIAGRSSDRVRDAGERLGVPDHGYVLDLTQRASIQSFCDAVTTRFGPVSLLVNNAGMHADGDKTILDVPAETVMDTFQVNALGALMLAQSFLPAMMQVGRGAIVNVSSESGRIALMGTDLPAYRLSKLALNALTIMLSRAAFGHGIRVNSICPGWCRTDMGGADATRSAEEGAADIVWLAMNDARISGKFFIGREVAEW